MKCRVIGCYGEDLGRAQIGDGEPIRVLDKKLESKDCKADIRLWSNRQSGRLHSITMPFLLLEEVVREVADEGNLR